MTLERTEACHPAMLTDTAIAVQRHLIDMPLDAVISVGSVTELVNRSWKGCGNELFGAHIVQKALLELQAMDILEFDWMEDMPQGSFFRLLAPPNLSNDMAYSVRSTFYGPGFMGSYDYPAPYRFLTWVHGWVPVPEPLDEGGELFMRTAEVGDFVEMCGFSREGISTDQAMLKILRELRLMRAINFTRDDSTITFRSKDVQWLSERHYREVFGAEPE